MGMVRYPLPITPAMLLPANANVTKPRYSSGTDWNGGSPGPEVDTATSTVAIANSGSAQIDSIYVPRTQAAKAASMVPARTILDDLGKDYGAFTGTTGRMGTIQPRDPYPAVKP